MAKPALDLGEDPGEELLTDEVLPAPPEPVIWTSVGDEPDRRGLGEDVLHVRREALPDP
jgi:hypothetical protein